MHVRHCPAASRPVPKAASAAAAQPVVPVWGRVALLGQRAGRRALPCGEPEPGRRMRRAASVPLVSSESWGFRGVGCNGVRCQRDLFHRQYLGHFQLQAILPGKPDLFRGGVADLDVWLLRQDGHLHGLSHFFRSLLRSGSPGGLSGVRRGASAGARAAVSGAGPPAGVPARRPTGRDKAGHPVPARAQTFCKPHSLAPFHKNSYYYNMHGGDEMQAPPSFFWWRNKNRKNSLGRIANFELWVCCKMTKRNLTRPEWLAGRLPGWQRLRPYRSCRVRTTPGERNGRQGRPQPDVPMPSASSAMRMHTACSNQHSTSERGRSLTPQPAVSASANAMRMAL